VIRIAATLTTNALSFRADLWLKCTGKIRSSQVSMKVLLLAAGRSKRAKPIEDKNFLRFCGEFLIQHQLASLKQAGFKEVIVMGGAHNLARLQEVAQPLGAQVAEQQNLDNGMAGAILDAAELIGNDDIFIVSSNDVVDQKAYDLMFKASQTDPQRSEGSQIEKNKSEALTNLADSYLLAYKVSEYFPGGYLRVDESDGGDSNKITGIVEKPGEGNEPSNMVNVVLHLHKNPAALFDALRETSSDRDDRYEVALDKLMKERKFQAVPYDGYWQPVKFPWHVLDLMQHFLANCTAGDQPQIDPSAEIAESAVIRGAVTIAAGVKVFDNAVIQGPAYIGEGSIVANNALVRGSILGARCVVGYSTEVARSFIGDDCWFHTNYIGDTVMGDNCSFGAGAICANLRLDEKEIKSATHATGRNKLGPILGENIRVGVQTSIMPGIRIGSGTMISSGLTISQDIEPGKFVKAKGPACELDIRENRAQLDDEARGEMREKL